LFASGTAKGEIVTHQATIERCEVRTANTDYNRYLSLYKEGAIAEEELDRKRLALETAQLNEARAKQDQSADTLGEQIRQAKATDTIAEVRPVDVAAAQAEIDRAIAAVKRLKADLLKHTSARLLQVAFSIFTPNLEKSPKGIAELGQTSQMQVVAEVYQTRHW